MSSAFYHPLGSSEIHPRYAFLEPLVSGRRVLEVGAVASTSGCSAAFLRSRGARRVLALDEDPDAVEAARRKHALDSELRFLAGRLEDVSDGPFDLVLVADAAPMVRVPSELDRVARLLASDGLAAFGIRHPAGATLALLAEDEPREPVPTWGELLAALQGRFGSVEAATQTAFVGYRLSPAGGGEMEMAVDATLIEPEDCGYYLALCSQRPGAKISDEMLVTLPVAPLAIAAGRRSELAERLRRAEATITSSRAEAPAGGETAGERLSVLEAELETAKAYARRLERDLQTLAAREREARARAERAEQEMARVAKAKDSATT